MKTSEIYAKGRDDERERIVEWLLDQCGNSVESMFYAKMFADKIAEREHLVKTR